MTTSVGVLLVHGIGEQRRFQHLENEVRNIASALQEDPGTRSVRVVVHSSRTAAYAAEQEIWNAEDGAPVTVEVTDTAGAVTELHFHEVWWADLDEPATLPVRIRFWLWGLSMWSLRGYLKPKLSGYGRNKMRPPSDADGTQPTIGFFGRVRLFVVGMIFLLILLTISLLNLLTRRVLSVGLPGPEILVNYVGDVKLYQQKGRSGKGPLAGLGERPRVTLRRRMVRALVQMATEDHDRWYLLAHSQGTVLAFNGLMETADSLPNYLDKAQWDAAKAKIGGTASTPLSPQEEADMMPGRPAWLRPDEIIDRSALFAKLAGFMTYGSPLDKFAVLWPVIVPMNGNETVFRNDFEWINVYDATDPVSSSLKHFHPKANQRLAPKNISYKARGLHLWSHIEYLTFKAGRRNLLVNKVAGWLNKGGAFPAGSPSSWRWPAGGLTLLYSASRYLMWIAFGIILAGILGYWFGSLMSAIGEGISIMPGIGDHAGPLFDKLVSSFTVWVEATTRWLDAEIGFMSVYPWMVRALFAIVAVALAVLVAGFGRKLRHWVSG